MDCGPTIANYKLPQTCGINDFSIFFPGSCVNDILFKKQKNIVDTVDNERYDFASLVKPKWEHNVHSSN